MTKVAAMPAPHQPVELREFDDPIRGCWGSEAGHFLRALTVLEMQAQAIPFRDIGARTYGLAELNQALEDAAAMRLPKALVAPQIRRM